MNLFSLYSNLIKKFYIPILFLLGLATTYLSINYINIKIDNSSDSLLLQSDTSLKYYRDTAKNYKEDSSLVIAYEPKLDLLSKENITVMNKMTMELSSIKNILSVSSLVNVPLLKSTSMSLSEMLSHIPTINDSRIDISKVKEELLSNPLYTNNLVSMDLKTTAIMLNTNPDLNNLEQTELIKNIREVINNYKDNGVLVLGGVAMIATDMGAYIKSDLEIYGLSIFILLLVILLFLYREIYFVLTTFVILTTTLLLGVIAISYFDLPITVISSNYMAMQLIITTSILIHLVVRYKLNENANQNNYEDNILITMQEMLVPTSLSILTTTVGFVSLLYSNILPIINLGLMMGVSIVISLLVTYLMFPSILMLITRKKRDNKFVNILSSMDNIIFNKSKFILLITTIIFITSVYFGNKIFVENSFIDYFKKETEIYKGMYLIDNKLGGTTPLDIIIDFKPIEKEIEDILPVDNIEEDEFSDFEDFEEDESDISTYWFSKDKLEVIKKVHEYLSNKDNIGKVLSAQSIIILGKQLNDNKELTEFELSLILSKMPEQYKDILIYPYVNIEKNQLRFTTRIKDSNKELRRDELIKSINKELPIILKDYDVKVHTTNIMVLYNNVLQSLFESQIKTLSLVILIIFVMFLILFRSLKYAFVGTLVNIIPIGTVFLLLGFLKIPLDMMTITIASISMGIAVDNTVHYLFKYRKERILQPVINAIKETNKTIGQAILYTTITIVLGFLVMLYSEFIPTVNFAILTSSAIFMAFLSNLLLLPVLLKKLDSDKTSNI
jgi:hypothetical protein